MDSVKLKKEYVEKQEKQMKWLSEYPYSKVDYYVYDEDSEVIVNIMRVSEIDNCFSSIEDIISVLNEQANTIKGLKTTKSRMRKDIRKYSKELSRLKLNINIYYNKLKEDFKL